MLQNICLPRQRCAAVVHCLLKVPDWSNKNRMASIKGEGIGRTSGQEE